MFEENADIAAFKAAHKASDVDAEPSSQHHTLGKGPTQAAPGNHGHTTYSVQAESPNRPAVGDEWVVTDLDNLRREWDGFTWVDRPVGNSAIMADAIDGMQITGALIRTSADSNRIELDGYNNVLRGYYGGSVMFELDANTGDVFLKGNLEAEYDNSNWMKVGMYNLSPQIIFGWGGNERSIDSDGGALNLKAGGTTRVSVDSNNTTIYDASFYNRAYANQGLWVYEDLRAEGSFYLPSGNTMYGVVGNWEHVNFDSSGKGTVFHGLGVTPATFVATTGAAGNNVQVTAVDSSSATLTCYNAAGNQITSASRLIRWLTMAH